MNFVKINDAVSFSAHEILVSRTARNVPWDELQAALQLAFTHMDNEYLVEACSGGRGPLMVQGTLTFERFLQIVRDSEIADAGRTAKRMHTRLRRSEFNAGRSQLLLKMIEAGIRHVCAHPECGALDELTVDHIVPLTRGGTDHPSNLQFLCRKHNSAKGDRI